MPISDHCPDCITLPVRPPYGCFPILLEAVKGNITDKKEVVHCAYTVIGWGLSFYIGPEAGQQNVLAADCDAVAELGKCCQLSEGVSADSIEKIEWKGLLGKMLRLILSLL